LQMEDLSISEDLVPSRSVKHAGTTEISFEGLLDPPLKLYEDLKEGCGGQLWPAGKVLAGHLLRRIGSLDHKTMFVFSQATRHSYC
jgi:protein N-lysine methyltransferase METTL21A